MSPPSPKLILLAFAVALLSGCATHNRRDPLEPVNRAVYGFNEAVDKAVLKPVARGYKAITPDPVESMVGNFFSNLGDVVVTFNDLLQLKLKAALSDSGRVLVNSTVGLLGIADVATALGMEKRNEDFGQTLGHYGIGSGPYLVLPFLGSSSLRDVFGIAVDTQVHPLSRVDHIPTRNQARALNLTDARARLLDAKQVLDDAALDQYQFTRDAYFQRRQNLIHDGSPPRIEDDEYLDEAKEGTEKDDGLSAGEAGTPIQIKTEAAPPHDKNNAPNALLSAENAAVTSPPLAPNMRIWLPPSALSNH